MPKGRVIALLTDFGLDDNYVGTMKAVIASINPKAHVIDLSHGIRPQDIISGAFVLGSSYKFFPDGTIFVAVVDPGVGGERKIVCAQTRYYTFLAPDNGILELVTAREEALTLVEVSNTKFFLPDVSSTFHGRDIFAPVAAHLSLGVKPAQLGNSLKGLKKINIPRPKTSTDGTLSGEVIYVDRFGNLITNIGHDLIRGAESRISSITIGNKKMSRLSTSYQDGQPGEPVALIGSSGHLEVAVNSGSASESLNCTRGDKVIVTFDKG
ncbi:MAG: S-adenosyl-l-methionine hydroxide adenosyltransferase family protein [Candidatus Brocadiales bacterium]